MYMKGYDDLTQGKDIEQDGKFNLNVKSDHTIPL